MKFEWIIKTIWEEEVVGKNSIPKLTFIVEEVSEKEWKASIAVNLFKDKIDIIKKFSVGDNVIVHLNSKCNEYNGKFYNSITGWKIEGKYSSPDETLRF